ncbi:hypothetical protein PVA48_01655 [Akkermansia sp. JRP_AM1]|uniref:hypothetical protein n=1 Tax=Akkermansia sp. JRP_AM1 TaxID=3414159 RepID=UPI003BFA6B50
MSMNLLASADTLPAAGGMSAPLAFIYDLFNNPLFIFIGGLVLLGVFFWYLGSDQDKVKRNAGTIFIIGIASFSLFSLFQQGLKYGIDIAGGVSFTLSVEPNIGDDGKPIPLTDQAMEQACVILTERLNSTGANDVIIRPKKKDNLNLIEVQIPAADPAKREETKAILTKVAKLHILPSIRATMNWWRKAASAFPATGCMNTPSRTAKTRTSRKKSSWKNVNP